MKLKSFSIVDKFEKIIIDNNDRYRIAKIGLDSENDLCVRYYLPISKIDRKRIKEAKKNYEIKKINCFY